jgi:hypothetical protein
MRLGSGVGHEKTSRIGMEILFLDEGSTVKMQIAADDPSDRVLHRRNGKGVNGEKPGHS